MANDTITFCCSACGIRLTVPAQLAGVTGPCPSCAALIQAPRAVEMPPLQPSEFKMPVGPVPSVGSPEGSVGAGLGYQELPPRDLVRAPAMPMEEPVKRLEESRAVGESGAGMAASSVPAALKVEPRKLPQRSAGEPVGKPMAEVAAGDASGGHSSGGKKQGRGGPLVRVVWLLVFLLLGIALVFGVMTYVAKQRKTDEVPGKRAESTVLQILPETPRPKPEKPAEVRAPDRKATGILPPPPPLPDGSASVSPGKAAMEVLEKFLAAKTLEERLPMMETRTPEAELRASCLAGPLPRVLSALNEGQETNALEQVVDVYFNIDFEATGGKGAAQTLLVRMRGAAAPKVVVDPFLDSFGGRLAKYAAAPSDKAGVFQVIISAIASCNDENVPNREKKLTLKLLPRDNSKEIARAYFGRQSKIGMMLEEGFSLGYGRAKACTVVLRWNTEDSQAHPYLEAIDLKALDWNP